MKRAGSLILYCISLYCISLILSSNCWGQEIDIENEVMQGYAEYQSGQFSKALSHFEKVIDFINQSQIDEIPNEALLSIYVLSGTCAHALGNYNQSLDYCNRALVLQNIPEEYLITLLDTKLQLCDDLAIKDECIATEKKLLKLYSTNKDVFLVQTLTGYYLAHEKYEDITLFEVDIPFLRPRDNSEINILSYELAMVNIYVALGKSYIELSDYDKSLKYFLLALNNLTEYNETYRSIICAYISNVYENLGDRANSIKYQRLAIESD